MLDRFGSLAAFANAELADLNQALPNAPTLPAALVAAQKIAFAGIHERAVATRLECCDPDFLDYLRLRLAARRHEILLGFFLANDGTLLCERTLATSAGHAVEISAAAVLREAVVVHAAQILLAHNHPSGEARSSAADEAAMVQLKTRAAAIDLEVVDHLIVAGPRIYSMKRRVLL